LPTPPEHNEEKQGDGQRTSQEPSGTKDKLEAMPTSPILLIAVSENAHAAQHKKSLTTKLILPFMSISSLLFFVAFYENTIAHNLILVLAVLSVAMNVACSSKGRTIKFSRFTFETRSEGFDAIRWLYNLLLYDTILLYVYRPTVAGMGLAWVILLTAAQSDLFQRKYQSLVGLIGLFIANVMIFGLYPEATLLEKIYVAFTASALPIIFNRSDGFWINEIKARVKSEEMEKQLIADSERLRFDAMLGEKLQFIMHEINNLLFVLEVSSNSNDVETRQKTFVKAHAKLKQISKLVLGDLRGKQIVRKASFSEILEDLEVLALSRLRTEQLDISTSIDDRSIGFQFFESKGSLFYILYNLLKNAREAVDTNVLNLKAIRIDAVVTQNETLLISVIDNGSGMSLEQKEALLSGAGGTTKATGHGIGMRFVRSECQKNSFIMKIPRSDTTGTTITLEIPSADRLPQSGETTQDTNAA
jgi:signal transduction histidine kinase